jgi:hypothetical protein
MAARHRAEDHPLPGDGLVRVGAVVFAVGVVAVVADFAPFFFGHSNLPTWLALSTLALPLGLGLALGGLLRQARAARRRAPAEDLGWVRLPQR